MKFDKNANSKHCIIEYDFVFPNFRVSLFGDNRGLRFSCVNFGWRTFLFYRKKERK